MGLFDGVFGRGGDLGWLSSLLPGGQLPPFAPQQQTAQAGVPGGLPPFAPNQAPQGMDAMAQAQPSQMGTPYAPPPNPGFGDRLQSGLAGFANAGSPMQALGNLIGGITTGARQDPMGIAIAQQQGLYQALRQKGMDHATAIAAISSPEILKESALFKTPKFVPNIGNDQFGQPQPGFVDERAQTVNRPQIAGGAPAAVGVGDMSVTGPEFLKTLDKPVANQVQAMLEGRLAPPTSMAAKSPYWQRMLQYAGQVEPDFDLTKWAARQAGNKDFYGGGKSSEMVRAANQTIHHVGELIGSMDKLNNGNFPMLNSVGNAINTQMGKGAVTEFLPNAHAVAEEMSKVFKGANLSDAEIRQWERSLHENLSPEQQRASIGKLMTLLNGSLSALEQKRRSSLGDNLSDQKGPLLDKESQHTLEKVNKWIAGDSGTEAKTAAPAEGMTATNPKTGQKIMLKNGQWVPVK